MLFKLESIQKSFGPKLVLKNLTLSVKRGEVVGLLGPNGAGKTTALKVAVKLLNPDRGAVLYRGKNTERDLTEYLSRIGYVPEEPIFYEHLTGWELLELIMALRGLKNSSEAEHLLKKFDLLDAMAVPVGDLSKGQRRGLSIVLALFHRPDLLLLDEPTSGLDPGHVHIFKEVLKEAVKGGTGAILSTHITSLAEEVCHRVAIIKRGVVVAGPSSLEELLKESGASDLEELFLSVVGSK